MIEPTGFRVYPFGERPDVEVHKLILVVLVSLVFSVSGCGGSSSDGSLENDESSKAAETQDPNRGGDPPVAQAETVGGMERDPAKERELSKQLTRAKKELRSQTGNAARVNAAIYRHDDNRIGPTGAIVLLRAKLKHRQSPVDFVDSFSEQAVASGFEAEEVAAGEGGGRAVCASRSQGRKVAVCAWATRHSMGELVPTMPGWEAKKLAALMRSVRSDIGAVE